MPTIVLHVAASHNGLMTEMALPAPRPVADKRWLLMTGVALCCGLLGWWATTEPADDGPLALPDNGSSWSGGPVIPGQWMVTTISTAELSGSAPAVIYSVRPADPDQADGLILRYAVLASTNHGLPGAVRGWPPAKYPLTSLRGFVVQPGDELNLIVGATSRHTGAWLIDAFDVTYQVAGRVYTTTFLQGIRVRSSPTCPACRSRTQLKGKLDT